jgi:hypothetical protein
MLEFIGPVIASLAWPIAAIVIVCLLRGHLGKLLDRVERAETKWANLSFSRAIRDVGAEFLAVEGKATDEQGVEPKELLTVEGKATDEQGVEPEMYAPVAEVMSAWADVEDLCRELLAKKGVNVPRTYRALGSRLKRNQLIDSEHSAILGKLRQVRNIAVHGSPETVGAREAQEYIILAHRMMTYLDRQLADE